MSKIETVKMVNSDGQIANPRKSDQAIWEAAGGSDATKADGKAIIADHKADK